MSPRGRQRLARGRKAFNDSGWWAEKAIQVQVGARGPWFFSKLLLMSKRNVLRSPFLLLTV